MLSKKLIINLRLTSIEEIKYFTDKVEINQFN